MPPPEHIKKALRGANIGSALTARTFNTFVEQIDRVDRLENNQRDDFRSIEFPRAEIPVFYLGSTDRGQYEPVIIGDARFTNSDNLLFFKQRVYQEADSPTVSNLDDPFGITAAPGPADTVIRVRVSGFTQAKIRILNTSHKFATPASTELAQLVSSATKGARIIWKEPGTGTGKFAIIDLSNRASPSTLSDGFKIGKSDSTISAGGNGTISIWGGTPGSETDTGANLTAYDWFGTGARTGQKVQLWFNLLVGVWYFSISPGTKSIFAHRNSSNQVVTSGTTANVIFDTSVHSDPESKITIASNVITISDDGFFHFSIAVPWSHSTAGTDLNPQVFVDENGTEIEAALETTSTSPPAYEAATFDFTHKIDTSGSTYRVRFTAPGVGTWTIIGGGAGVPNARIDIHKVRDL